MKNPPRLRLTYLLAGLLALAFFVWTVDLLLGIQADWARSSEISRIDKDVHALFDPWRNLNRPGNDVLENYAVDSQLQAFARYQRDYLQARQRLDAHRAASAEVVEFIDGLDRTAEKVTALANRTLALAAERERLRLAGEPAGAIRTVETEAATHMARMDQAFQDGLDLIARLDQQLDRQLLALEDRQRDDIRSLYAMLLVALFTSALSIALLRRTALQREALRLGTARINAIVNNVVDGIVTVDEKGNIESFNPTAAGVFGYRAEQVIGKPFTLLLDESCRDEYRDYLRRYGAGEAIDTARHEYEELGKRSDGVTFPMELAASRITLDGRRLLVHIVRDITERKQAEERLRLAASVFENTTEGIVITDHEARIQSVNPAFTAITGYRADEVIGANPRLLQSGMQSAEFYRNMWAKISETGHWQGEIQNRRKNGEIYPQWLNINAIKDHRGKVTNYVGVTFDITELKASERLKDEFIATVSHELRTPLTSIRGSLGLLTGGVAGDLPAAASKLLHIAVDNSERLVRLIDDILDIAKMEAETTRFHLQPVMLDELIGRAIEANQGFARQLGVEIRRTGELPAARVVGDGDRLMQVMTNLLSNAAKHSPRGGTVEVGLERRDQHWRVTVTDRGKGIPESFRGKVFEKFAQADGSDRRRGSGTGLGLSICKAIVDRLGGDIGFDSQVDRSTTFYFELPVMSARDDPATGRRAAGGAS